MTDESETFSKTRITEERDDVPGPEPSVESMVDQAMGLLNLEKMLGKTKGWADLDQRGLDKDFKEQQRLQAMTMKREAALFRDVLWANDQGRRLLELLCDMTLRRRTWPNALLIDPHALMAEGIWREAENSFVAAMIDAIAVAEGEQPKGRSHE